MERAKRVDAQMKKVRTKKIQEKKLKNESYHLHKEAEKLTNPLKPIRNSGHLIGEIIEIELDDHFEDDCVVSYKFGNWTRYARLVEHKEKSATFSIFDIDPTNSKNLTDVISCVFKNRRLKRA